MNRRLFTPRKSPAQKFVTGLVAIATLALLLTAGAILWGWFSDETAPLNTANAQDGNVAANSSEPAPIILAKADKPVLEPDTPPTTQSKPAPLDKPLAAAPDGTPSFFFASKGICLKPA